MELSGWPDAAQQLLHTHHVPRGTGTGQGWGRGRDGDRAGMGTGRAVTAPRASTVLCQQPCPARRTALCSGVHAAMLFLRHKTGPSTLLP